MKINGASGIPALKPRDVGPWEESLEFDDFINADLMLKVQGDEYYWQHQAQLQHSALTFNQLKFNDIDLKPAPVINALKSVTRRPVGFTDDSISIEQLSKKTPVCENFLLKDELPTKIINDQLLCLHKTITSVLCHENPTNFKLNISSRKSCNIVEPHKLALPVNIIFKDYHLFLNNNLVELSFTTSQVATHELQELHELILNKLTREGYVLKKLIINGVSYAR